jgi:hypothetical protein
MDVYKCFGKHVLLSNRQSSSPHGQPIVRLRSVHYILSMNPVDVDKMPETGRGIASNPADRTSLTLLDGLSSLLLRIAERLLTAILTVFYAFRVPYDRIEQESLPPSRPELNGDDLGRDATRVHLIPTSSPVKLESADISPISLDAPKIPFHEPIRQTAMPVATVSGTSYPGGIKAYYQAKIEAAELTINERTQNLRRLEAQRNALNARGAPIVRSAQSSN